MQKGYHTVFLDQVYAYVCGSRVLKTDEVCLTFDDGFLDNWVYVYPLAKRLGFRFTVFVNPEFVDPRGLVRPNLNDVMEGTVAEKDLEWWGYLSWPEMRLMEKSGLVDIQSHALTHTWYPSSSEVVDFHHPGDSYHWLTWNAFPETKPFFLSDFDETKVPYGTPVHASKKAIQARRFFPDNRIAAYLAAHVAGRGERAFFQCRTWRDELHRVWKRLLELHGDRGHFETKEEHEARVRNEVCKSKSTIEKALGKKVRFLCWPGGGETPLARRLALEAGYLGTTKGTALNRPGNDPSHISRVSPWFGAPLPEWFKWWLFEGQLDRARGVISPCGVTACALAAMRKAVT